MSQKDSKSDETWALKQPLSSDEILAQLQATKTGLSLLEAQKRLEIHGLNALKPPKRGRGLSLIASQFTSPLILLLIGAAVLSLILGDKSNASIILAIVLLSGLLGFSQERGALNELDRLLRLVEIKTAVLREGKETKIFVEEVVPGDIVLLRAGDLVPADCALIEAKHLFVNESILSGESLPVEKTANPPLESTPLLKQLNALFFGTLVASGFATAVVVATGKKTQWARLAEKVQFHPPETAFEINIRHFGKFLLQVTLVLTVTIFFVNAALKKDIVESFLFCLALAVGLTPQLLPAIISVNLSHGARRMAQKKVVVKRLASIENFGQMNILCTDKTGTITIGKMEIQEICGIDGQLSEKAKLYSFLNARFQAGYSNPLDQAILDLNIPIHDGDWKKIDEIPYDFSRKRLSVVLEQAGCCLLISKGAFSQIFSICTKAELADGTVKPIEQYRDAIEAYFQSQSEKGFRILALAWGKTDQEEDLVFLGFLSFYDPIKPGVTEAIVELKKKGIHLKILTGDHLTVTAHVATSLGLAHPSFLTGAELDKISDERLVKIAAEKNVFAQMDPAQKERIILALRKKHVVGYLGDGINDIAALHSADVGIAVDTGASSAQEAADIILLEKDLSVLRIGVEEGRRTFANTLKYVYMATSANLGNMFSMAGVSLFLNFLPLLPKQVLLTNFFSDLPEMALATDRVEYDTIARPLKWNFSSILRFMVVFGLLNALADFLTFGLLFWVNADPVLFRSVWFVENVCSAALVVLFIRTRKWFFRSKPSRLLLLSSIGVAGIVLLIPITSFGALFGFAPIPLPLYLPIAGIILFYLVSVETAKRFFFRHISRS